MSTLSASQAKRPTFTSHEYDRQIDFVFDLCQELRDYSQRMGNCLLDGRMAISQMIGILRIHEPKAYFTGPPPIVKKGGITQDTTDKKSSVQVPEPIADDVVIEEDEEDEALIDVTGKVDNKQAEAVKVKK